MAKRKAASRHRTRLIGCRRVGRLPRSPERTATYWINSPNGSPRLTHYLFKFPAKFHPPVVRWALGKYGRRGSTLIDPFNGSGTVQVEAMARGISSVGVDVDPVACLMATVKSTPVDPRELRSALGLILSDLHERIRAHQHQASVPGGDIDQKRYERESRDLWIPEIPNITHWLRKYVIIDLAALFAAVNDACPSPEARSFFKACAASIIRNVSNADPAPVSGLEVTALQAKKNRLRRISVFDTFSRKAHDAIAGMEELRSAHRLTGGEACARVVQGDALDLTGLLAAHGLADSDYPLVITSPPYCRAVEYSRRHKLEMYWLGSIGSQEEHVSLKHKYLGRYHVRASDWDEDPPLPARGLAGTIESIGRQDHHRARTVRHYFAHMVKFFGSLSEVVNWRATIVVILGDSVCCGIPVNTARFAGELAQPHFRICNRFSYVLRNQYMQYGLWNGDGIREEHVLVMKPA